MHVVKSIIGEKSVGHQSLAKGINVQVVVAKGILRHLRKNRVQRSIFMALKLMMKLKTFSNQLYFHTLSINQVTKDVIQAFEVEVESNQCMKSLLCKVGTGDEGNVISLSTYFSQSHHIMMMLFLLTYHQSAQL